MVGSIWYFKHLSSFRSNLKALLMRPSAVLIDTLGNCEIYMFETPFFYFMKFETQMKKEIKSDKNYSKNRCFYFTSSNTLMFRKQ